MADINIIGGTDTVAAQYINTYDDAVRFRTHAAARRAIPDGSDAVVVQCRRAVPASLNARTMRRLTGAQSVDTADIMPLRNADGVQQRPAIADVALSRVVFGHRVARGADWIGSRPNADESRVASGARTTQSARDAFSAMLADTARRLDVPADALTVWIAANGATANVPTDDALTAMRATGVDVA